MIRTLLALPLAAALATAGAAAPQTAPADDVVSHVRDATAEGGWASGERALREYRAARGTTPDALDALCWLARGALAERLFDRASRYAQEAREAADAAMAAQRGAEDPRLLAIVGSALETTGRALVEQGDRSEAVYILRRALQEYHDASIGRRIEAAVAVATLEGRPAPPLDAGVSIGARPARGDRPRQPQLLFFWAHWCQDCKAESAALARVAAKYEAVGLQIVAPTRRYGYVEAGRSADPAKELRHIVAVRDASYPFLKHAAVPVTDANYRAYGVAAVPMHVLVDRSGVIRLYQPGRMGEAELDAAIAEIVAHP